MVPAKSLARLDRHGRLSYSIIDAIVIASDPMNEDNSPAPAHLFSQFRCRSIVAVLTRQRRAVPGRVPPMIRIVVGDLNDSRVIALLKIHLLNARAQTAPGSAHALDLDGLQSPGVTFWTIWDDEILLGMGALKRLSPDHGEVKSRHTVEAMRRKGLASMRHIIAAARASGMVRLSLETGSWDYFRPARALYKKHGFVECRPFADYVPDPNSVFMTLDLSEW